MLVNDPNFSSVPPTIEAVPIIGGQRRGLTVRDLFMVLFRRKRIAIQFFVASCLLGVLASIAMAKYPVYPAKQNIVIRSEDDAARAIFRDLAGAPEDMGRETLYQNYLLFFDNPTIYQTVVDELRLHELEKELWETQGKQFMKHKIAAALNSFTHAWLGFQLKPPPQDKDFRDLAVWRLKSSISVQLQRGTKSTMVIRYSSPTSNQELTARIIDEVLKTVEGLIDRDTRGTQIIQLTEQLLEDAREVLSEEKDEYQAFLRKHDLFTDDLNRELETRRLQLQQLEYSDQAIGQQLEDNAVELEYARKQVSLAGEMAELGVSRQRTPEEVQLTALQSLKTQREIDLRTLQEEDKAGITVNNKEVARLQYRLRVIDEQIEKLKESMVDPNGGDTLSVDEMLAKLTLDRVEDQRQTLETRRLGLQERLDRARSDFLSFQDELARGIKIVADYRGALAARDDLQRNVRSLRRQQNVEQQISPFERPNPVRASGLGGAQTDKVLRLGLVIGGIVFGLFGAIALAFLRDFVDRSVKSVEDVEDSLGLPVIASIPRDRKFKRLLN